MPNTSKVSEKYIDLISQDSKEEDKQEKQFRADEAKLQVESSILETKKAIAVAERELAQAKKAVPYSLEVEVEVEKTQNLESLKEGLKLANTIYKARF